MFVGVVQQNVAIDADCLETYCRLMQQHSNITIHTANSHDYSSSNCPYYDNIRMTRIDASEAKGPVWARAKGSLMMKEEEFCMQLDSHMDFVNNWETKLMQMWGLTNNEYAVLSTYVTSTDELKYNLDGQLGVNNLFEVPHLCMVTFEGLHGMVRNWGTKCMRKFPAPKLTNALWGAGLSFSKCHAERKVPYDPYLPHIFDGEEYSRALRFWTWGYDIYTPHRTYVVHNYKKSQVSKHCRMHLGVWFVFFSISSDIELNLLRYYSLLNLIDSISWLM